MLDGCNDKKNVSNEIIINTLNYFKRMYKNEIELIVSAIWFIKYSYHIISHEIKIYRIKISKKKYYIHNQSKKKTS